MRRQFQLRWVFVFVLSTAAVIAGCTGQIGDPANDTTSGSGGTPDSTAAATGGSTGSGTGGSATSGSGGADPIGTGGSTSSGTGGATTTGTGGSMSPGTGGTTTTGTGGSSTGTGGASSMGTGGSSLGGNSGINPGSGGSAPGTPDAGLPPDPFSAAPTCTSKTTWNSGNQGSGNMNPGKACIACHKTSGGEAPGFSIAGTLYPTAHEPDLCNGTTGSGNAQIVITGADGKTLTLKPNSAGNFYSTTSVKLPYQAKVLYNGQTRAMVETQSTGDCNSCHTQNGTSAAPGRILLP